jgi:hypothetical protein
MAQQSSFDGKDELKNPRDPGLAPASKFVVSKAGEEYDEQAKGPRIRRHAKGGTTWHRPSVKICSP